MTKAKKISWKYLLLIALFALATEKSAHAQRTEIHGYNLQLFQLSTDNLGLISLETSDLPEPGQLTFKTIGNYSRGQLSVVPSNGITRPVLEKILTVDSLFSITLTDFVSAGFSLPYSPYKTGNRVLTGDPDIGDPDLIFQSGSNHPLGDIKFFTKWRLHHNDKKGFWPGLGLVLYGTMPTGSEVDFVGEQKPTMGGTVIIDKRFRKLGFTSNVGVKLLQEQIVLGTQSDDALTFGFGVRVPTKLSEHVSVNLLSEFAGQTPLTHPTTALTPIEFRAGLETKLRKHWGVLLGASAGLNNSIGNTDYRAIFGLSWDGSWFAKAVTNASGSNNVPTPQQAGKAKIHHQHRKIRLPISHELTTNEELLTLIKFSLNQKVSPAKERQSLIQLIANLGANQKDLCIDIVIKDFHSRNTLILAYERAQWIRDALVKSNKTSAIYIRLAPSQSEPSPIDLSDDEIVLKIIQLPAI